MMKRKQTQQKLKHKESKIRGIKAAARPVLRTGRQAVMNL